MTLLAFAGETPPLHFCGSPCGIVLIKVYLPCRTGHGSGRSLCRVQARAQPDRPWGRSRQPSAAVSRPPGGWGCALPPRKPAKNPNPSLGRPLQPAGFGPQGSRPADGFGGLRPPTAPLRGAGPAGPLPAQTYPTGSPRSIGCNCRPSSAAASAAPVRESSAARLVGFFRGSSCPKGTK